MKISLSTAQKLLEELGVDVELVAENDDTGVDVSALASEATEYLKPQILSAAKEGTEAELNGKFLGTLRSAVQRTLNIPKKEMEEKSVSEIMAIIKANTESHTGEAANEWKSKYEAAVQDYETQLENTQSTWQSKYDNDIKAANDRYTDRDINDAIVGIVNKMPRSGGDPVKQARVLRNLAKEAGYEMSFDEASKALKMVKDGKPAKVEEAFNELAADVLPLAKNTSHIAPNSVNGQPPVQRVENTTYEGLPAGDKLAAVFAAVNK